jgi:hypothetical protein
VSLPDGSVHAWVWFRLLRRLLDEVSAGPSVLSAPSQATMDLIWSRACMPVRGGLAVWRPREQLAWPIQQAMVGADSAGSRRDWAYCNGSADMIQGLSVAAICHQIWSSGLAINSGSMARARACACSSGGDVAAERKVLPGTPAGQAKRDWPFLNYMRSCIRPAPSAPLMRGARPA